MRFPGLNSRQCRALMALQSRGTLSTGELARAIGPYATNTIASLVDKGLVSAVGAGVVSGEDLHALSSSGAAIASVIVAAQPRAAVGGAR